MFGKWREICNPYGNVLGTNNCFAFSASVAASACFYSLNFCMFQMRFNENNHHERRVIVSGSINNWIWILMREGKIQDSKKAIDTMAAVSEPEGFLVMKDLLKWITAPQNPLLFLQLCLYTTFCKLHYCHKCSIECRNFQKNVQCLL